MSDFRYLGTTGEDDVKQWFGIYFGTVANNNDPTGQGRVQAFVPQVLGAAVTQWASPVVPLDQTQPTGAQIMVMFAGGDLDYPVYFTMTTYIT